MEKELEGEGRGEEEIIFFLYDFLGELKEDLKAEVPQEVIDKVGDICEEEFKKRGMWE